MNQPWLRAGLISAGVLIVVNLLGLIPALGGVALPLMPVALAGAGALAASFMLPRREAGRGAGQGALAGLLAGLAGGITFVIMLGIGVASMGGPEAIVSQLPPQLLEQYSQAGIDPAAIFSTGLLTTVGVICCLPAMVAGGALLGALGGLVYAAAKPD
ncbi:MAG: hypothetical protein ACM30E_03110 [Nitrososphaerales archaeon]